MSAETADSLNRNVFIGYTQQARGRDGFSVRSVDKVARIERALIELATAMQRLNGRRTRKWDFPQDEHELARLRLMCAISNVDVTLMPRVYRFVHPCCDWCTRPATLVARDSDDFTCRTCARDHYTNWRASTRTLTARDVAAREEEG